MRGPSDELWKAYEATDYLADTPWGTLSIRIGRRNARLDALLARFDAKTWAFVTAHNPGSELLDDASNAARHELLLAAIERRRFPCFPGRGCGEDGTWPAEESLLVIGISPEQAAEIGRLFGQYAVVCGCLGDPAELFPCRTP